MRRRTALAHLLAAASLLGACASPAPEWPIERLQSARFVLLGELHDNPEHHRLRAELLRRLLADGRPTRVVFEQMPRGREAAIAAAGRDADAVASAGGLDRKAWQWPMHEPVLQAALDAGAQVVGGNIEREPLRAVAREGLAGVPAELRRWVTPESPWTPEQQATLETLIDQGHCGMLPKSQWQPMVLAQRTRDAAMAQAMLDAPAGHRVVLIAGNGHVRDDVGVPHYLRLAGAPREQIVSVGFVERGDSVRAPFAIERRTAKAERPDPCESLRQRKPASS